LEALLIYNPNAGGVTEDQAKTLQEELNRLGYHPTYRATKTEEELDRILPQANGLVVVVGGDGTLRAVTTRMVDRDLPILLLPNGTANNVGRTLGIQGTPMELLGKLPIARGRLVDMGRMSLPWGETYFLEGAGMGLFAEALDRYRPNDGKSFLRGAKTLLELMVELPSRYVQMRVDGKEEEGEYLLVEAMNMGAIGPRLGFASDADPSDGYFDLVRIRADQRESYVTYLRSLISGDFQELESVERTRVKKLEMKWDGFPVHQDASCISYDPEEFVPDSWITFELLQHNMEFLIPTVVPTEAVLAQAV
jgi:diacylglycerol kinase (ATP)